jgi:50S ribosomal protein L16 3-hydroxylase
MMTSSLPDARTFLARYWQKKPLFARGALPRFANVLTRAQIFELACRDDVESRLVTGARKSWRVEQGPFSPARPHAPAAARVDAARKRD